MESNAARAEMFFGGGLRFHQQGEAKALLCGRVTPQVATDAWKHGTESLLLPTDDIRSCLDSANMASHTILFFGGDDGRNMEGLGSIGVDVFSIVLISRADYNKDCF